MAFQQDIFPTFNPDYTIDCVETILSRSNNRNKFTIEIAGDREAQARSEGEMEEMKRELDKLKEEMQKLAEENRNNREAKEELERLRVEQEMRKELDELKKERQKLIEETRASREAREELDRLRVEKRMREELDEERQKLIEETTKNSEAKELQRILKLECLGAEQQMMKELDDMKKERQKLTEEYMNNREVREEPELLTTERQAQRPEDLQLVSPDGNDTSGDLLSIATKLQQNYYELLSDWNIYRDDEHEYLKKNIRYALCKPPESDSVGWDYELSEDKKKIITTFYEKIVTYGSRSTDEGHLCVNIIYNVIFGIEGKEDVFPIPVFKIRRCFKTDTESFEQHDDNNSGELLPIELGITALHSYCVWYIDTEGRIYQNWTDYVRNNTLPKCTMVIPMGGYYQPNPRIERSTENSTMVWLENGPSPMCRMGAKVLSGLDIVSSVVSFGSLGVGVAAMVTPLGPPILAASAVSGVVSSLYTAGRCTQQLADRSTHDQSISVTDKQARAAWLGVAGSVTGVAASSATAVLGRAVRAGATIGLTGQAAYNSISVGNLIVNGVGIGNGVYNIFETYTETGEFAYLEIAQLSAHVLFFGNAVINLQTAGQLIRSTQGQVMREYETSLRSNRHRRAFRRITHTTRAAHDNQISADAEIIRGVQQINNRDDFFAGIVRNRRVFRETQSEVTFRDGQAMINDVTPIDPMAFSKLSIDARVDMANASQSVSLGSNVNVPQKMSKSTYHEQLSSAIILIEKLCGTGATAFMGKGDELSRMIIQMHNLEEKDILLELLVTTAKRLLETFKYYISGTLRQILNFLWTFVVEKTSEYISQYKLERQLSNDLLEKFNSDRGIGPNENLFNHYATIIIHKLHEELDECFEEIIERFSSWKQDNKEQQKINQFKRIPEKCPLCSSYYFKET